MISVDYSDEGECILIHTTCISIIFQLITESSADLLQLSSAGQRLQVSINPSGFLQLNVNGEAVRNITMISLINTTNAYILVH